MDEKTFNTAIEHPARCSCDLCLIWWAEYGARGDFGPFTREQVNAKRRELGIEVKNG